MPSSAPALLADLFSKARLSLNLPSSSASTSRSVVFFDEVLNVETVLTLPADPLFPIASASTQAVPLLYPLPLPVVPDSTTLSHQSISPYLTALLACLHVNLATDYVPIESSSSINPTAKSANPYEPLSTVPSRFQHLQLLPSHTPLADPAHTQHAAVRAFSNAWAGNQPPRPHRTLKDSVEHSASAPSKSSHNAHLTHDGQHWSVHWHCRIPINYVATPFLPFLSITAALTLRLDHALLDHLIPTSSSRPFNRSGFAHSLLSPLHEGPVYPDESPLQSQARANASSAFGLDGPNGLGSYLAHLPKSVVGGNNAIVTPRSGASALDSIQQRSHDALSADPAFDKSLSQSYANGDLAALSSRSAPNRHGPQSPSQFESYPQSSGLHIYKRSTRQLLPLKTGLNVRMRTLVTNHGPHIHRRHLSQQAFAELESTRLVLSVELENPFDSDAAFTIHNIQIKVGSSQADEQESHTVVAKPLLPIDSVLPIQLTRGSQRNMLFYVSVEADHAMRGRKDDVAFLLAGSRNVTVTVSGRPQGDQEQLADFDSQWNCALDLTPVLFDATKKDLIASPVSTSRPDYPLAGPVAGSSQYAASSLRAAAHNHNRLSYTQVAPPRAELTEDLRTPRPGQLGMGFPPPMRTSSARHFSTATAASPVQHASSERCLDSQEATSFLHKARARTLNRQSASQLDESNQVVAAPRIKPWTSHSTALREFAAGGLVILSTVRHAGANSAAGRDSVKRGGVKFEPSLDDVGGARSSVSAANKTLPPISNATSTAEGRAVRFKTDDTVIVDLTFLYSPATFNVAQIADAITDVTLSWAQSTKRLVTSQAANRDTIDVSPDTAKTRLIDADSARLKSSVLLSQAQTLNGLIPTQDHLALSATLLPSQSRSIELALRCLSPGYHVIPPLQLAFHTTSGGQRKYLLDDLGSVYVTPAAVL